MGTDTTDSFAEVTSSMNLPTTITLTCNHCSICQYWDHLLNDGVIRCKGSSSSESDITAKSGKSSKTKFQHQVECVSDLLSTHVLNLPKGPIEWMIEFLLF